jgi:hypothetical protein
MSARVATVASVGLALTLGGCVNFIDVSKMRGSDEPWWEAACEGPLTGELGVAGAVYGSLDEGTDWVAQDRARYVLDRYRLAVSRDGARGVTVEAQFEGALLMLSEQCELIAEAPVRPGAQVAVRVPEGFTGEVTVIVARRGEVSGASYVLAEDRCGNGLMQRGEDCDGSDLDGLSCSELGYVGGTLACSVSCELDTRRCERETEIVTEATLYIEARQATCYARFADIGYPLPDHDGHLLGLEPDPTIERNLAMSREGPVTSFTYPGFNTTFSNLEPRTRYYCRAYAEQSGSIRYGDSIGFTTLSEQ